MTAKLDVSTFDLVNCFTSVLDLVSPSVMHHHKRVAYIAFRLATELNLPLVKVKRIFLASLLHDVGLLSLHERLNALQFEIDFEDAELSQHGSLGQFLIKDYFPFSEAAPLIEYHHLYWRDRGNYRIDDDTLLGSEIIHLADRIDSLIDREQEILSQVPGIISRIEAQSGIMFCPETIKVFKVLAGKEYFWLDILNPQSYGAVTARFEPEMIHLDTAGLMDLTKTFCRIIDFRSPFTAAHSAGVSAVAEALAGLTDFPPEEIPDLKIAGNLHDLGKLAVPQEILEKPGKLTSVEFNIIKTHAYHGYRTLETIRGLERINSWGSLHHERLDGNGYPFHFDANNLSLGSRIMAVADIFTALLEARPYRKGLDEEAALQIIVKMAEMGAIDREITDILKNNAGKVASLRREAQQKAIIEYDDFRAAMFLKK